MTNPTETEQPPVAAPRGGTKALQFLDDLRNFLAEDLGRVEDRIQSAVGTNHEFHDLSRQAAAMGGKRLRPMLVLLSARAIDPKRSNAQRDDLISIAASVELVHAASLVHDDVLDRADLRRHRPTILSQTDNKTAILLGDFLFTKAFAIAASCRSTLPARQIAGAAAELCTGELRQGMAAGNWQISLQDYRQMLIQKTGSLCGTSCRLGGWRSGGSKADRRSLKRFGVMLGLAFQVYDDWLDYWGSDAVGKTLGTDLQQGKSTLPILRYLTSQPEKKPAMLQLLNSAGPDQFTQVLAQLDKSDAAEYTLRSAKRLAQRARDSILHLPGSQASEFLQGLAAFSADRRS